MPGPTNPVEVKVEVITSTVGSITLKVDPEPVHVKGHDGISWTIATAGWSFVQHPGGGPYIGVEIKNPAAPFSRHSSSNKNHTVKRDNTDGKPYRYTVSVTDNANTTLSWDPSIMND